MHHDFDRCARAMRAKDPRFDGWFVVAVRTTGIYCRPSCPARTPHPHNVEFHPTSAAAQQAGFRACKRCRPDASPGSPEWDVRGDVVARAMRLIADGTVDREGVPGVAARLGYSTRQVERLLLAEVGAGPLALARAQRAQTARVLVETTALRFADVAFAAGFASIRQFNDTVRAVFAATPTELRTRAGRSRARASEAVTLRLPFRQPCSLARPFAHLARTAVPGCEEVADGIYRRVLRLPGGTSTVALTPTPDHVAARLTLGDLRDLPAAIARVRRLLDLDADPEAVVAALGEDAVLRPLVRAAPGRRVLRGVDGTEQAVRIVLGQQVSLAAARTHLARLVARHGEALPEPDGALTHAFPTADELTAVDAADLAVPATRRRSFAALVDALATGTAALDAGADWDWARARFAELPGIGPWSREMIALRALGDPDAFPATDLGIRRAAAALGLPTGPAALLARAERWRPWRAYAAEYLWASLDHRIARTAPRRVA